MRTESLSPSSDDESADGTPASSASMSFSDVDSDLLLESSFSGSGMMYFPQDIMAGLDRERRSAVVNSQGGEEDSAQTILSSRSGRTAIPPPQASRDTFFASSPWAGVVAPSGQISLSTTETGSLPFDAFQGDDYDETIASIYTRSSDGDNDDRPHETAIVARRSTSCGTASHHDWYNRLVSESDWDEFRIAAHAVLSAILQPRTDRALLPLPPNPPTTAMLLTAATSRPSVSYVAEDHVAPEIVCRICKDVLVGAIKLDCLCPSAMVCASCWDDDHGCQEKHQMTTRSPEFAERMDFVWIDKSKNCPCCRKHVDSITSCHALDVAILHIVRDLPETQSNGQVTSLKQNYYSRLAAWRANVYEKNEILCRREDARHDELLARLIQEEERVLWGNSNGNRFRQACLSTNGILFLGQAAVALLAATMASIGLSSLRR